MILFLLTATIESDTDREFMMRLYTEYYPLMRSKAYGIVREYAIVDDLVNDACVRLIGKISLLRDFDCCKLAAYIVYTVRSVSVDYIRRQSAQNKRVQAGFTADDDVADNGKSTEEIMIQSEEIDALRSAVMKLPERERDILHFKYTLEMKDAEIAQTFGIQPSSVRSLISRTRRKVYELIREEGSGYGE